MKEQTEIKILPRDIQNTALIKQKAISNLGIDPSEVTAFKVVRRSIDARSRQPVYRLRVDLYTKEQPPAEPRQLEALKHATNDSKEVVVLGAGPAGYFAALELLELGLKPIVLDRGKQVRERRRDLRAIQQFGEVNANSNYCFGEGGAGTYSDGKLYTKSLKRGNYLKVLRLLVEHGANPDILIDAHPHIGSNKLPSVVSNIRETILSYGGEIHFDTLITDFLLENGKMKGVVDSNGKQFTGEAVILATGHSARDIFQLLLDKNIHIEAKPFALGVRIEHPQSIVDQAQYRQKHREEHLPASSYKLVCQVRQRGVFSFCMCPGGLVVPAATAPGEIVVNGMSMSKRNSKFANSGTVVAIELEDLKPYESHGVFAGLAFQKSVEQAMFNAGDGSQKAPAQRLTDFVQGTLSKSLAETSYIPGLFPARLDQLLPKSIASRLKIAVQEFDKKLKGYYTEEANVIGVESRTSSPVRIPRNRTTYMHEQVEGLFPCGEGAGYAGGILSAAMDGQNVAKAVNVFIET